MLNTLWNQANGMPGLRQLAISLILALTSLPPPLLGTPILPPTLILWSPFSTANRRKTPKSSFREVTRPGEPDQRNQARGSESSA